MYAIVQDSGTQIKVSAGDVVDLDLRELSEGTDSITLDRVLMLSDGGEPVIGTPYVQGAAVTAELVKPVRGDKVRIFTYKRRKGYRRRMGHRQSYLRVRITQIRTG